MGFLCSQLWWLATATSTGLAGCATAPASSGDPKADERGEFWSGRLSLTVAATDTQPSRGFSASFELSGHAQQGQLDLSGPLGAQALRVSWAPGRYVLDTGSGPQDFQSLDALVRASLGEPLPLTALFFWLRGQPWPQAAFRSSAQGFEQADWQLDTQALAEGLLRAQRPAGVPAASSPAVSLRIRLDRPPQASLPRTAP